MPTPIPAPPNLPTLRIQRDLPPYRYVPGLQAHPLRGGHGGAGLTTEDGPDTAWARGLDLLGCRFPWEAHEAFELAWLAWRVYDPPRGKAAAGLAKVGASWLRTHAGDARAAQVLLARARAQILPVTTAELERLLLQTQVFVDGGRWPTWPR